MDKQLKITIARKRNFYFLMLNKQEFSIGFKDKLEGFHVILESFLSQRLSFENLKSLFVTITNSDQIPSFSMHRFFYEEQTNKDLIQISEILESTNTLFDHIQMTIDFIEAAMIGPVPRFVHQHDLYFIQYNIVEKVSDIFIKKTEVLEEYKETEGIRVLIDLKRTLPILDKQTGERVIEKLYQNKQISIEDYDNLMIELRKIPIPEKVKTRKKKVTN